MRKYLFTGVATTVILSGFAVAQMNVESKSTVLQAEKREFALVMDPISFADAYGDREKGPHGTYGQFPANFETPAHTHSHEYRAIVVKGEMTNPFVGEENSPVMTVGSYWHVAAGEEHTTACVSDTPCEFFMYSNEGFDFTPVE